MWHEPSFPNLKNGNRTTLWIVVKVEIIEIEMFCRCKIFNHCLFSLSAILIRKRGE